MDIILDNNAFEQEIAEIDKDSFNAKRRKATRKRRRSMLVKGRSAKGKVVYGKSGKRLKGLYVRK